MIRLLLVIAASLFLQACGEPQSPPMPNDEIISETKKCEAAGMVAKPGRTMLGITKFIQCESKEQVTK